MRQPERITDRYLAIYEARDYAQKIDVFISMQILVKFEALYKIEFYQMSMNLTIN